MTINPRPRIADRIIKEALKMQRLTAGSPDLFYLDHSLTKWAVEALGHLIPDYEVRTIIEYTLARSAPHADPFMPERILLKAQGRLRRSCAAYFAERARTDHLMSFVPSKWLKDRNFLRDIAPNSIEYAQHLEIPF